MQSSTPTLQRHDNGTYYIHWTENRVSKRVSTRQKDLASAKVFLGQWLLMDRAAEQDERKGASFTIADLWPIYIEKKIVGGPSEKGVKSLSTNLLAHFGSLMVSQVSQKSVDDYIRKRTTGKLGRLAKPNSCRKELLQLSACLNFCCKRKYGQKLFDPILFDGFNMPPEAEPRDRWLRHAEMEALHGAAEAMGLRHGRKRLTRLQRFLWLALETAGRETAIRELTWDRVDWEMRMIDLRNPDRPLTFKKAAMVPISDPLMAILKQAYAERKNEYVLDHPGNVWESVQWAVVRAGLDPKQQSVSKGEIPKATGISPHVFRHTAATHMARRGVPLWVIANILGNTVDKVEKVYAKWQPEAAREAVNMISRSIAAE